MRRQLVPAVLTFLAFTLLVGVFYPLAVTGVSQVAFGDRADGSLVRRDGVVVGSSLLGQSFADEESFHPRPSAAGDGYDGAASSASNLGPDEPRLPRHDRGARRRLPRAERARRRHGRPGRRRDGVGLGARPGHLARQREAAGPSRGAGTRARARARARARRRQHARSHARVHGRAARERPRAQPRTRRRALIPVH